MVTNPSRADQRQRPVGWRMLERAKSVGLGRMPASEPIPNRNGSLPVGHHQPSGTSLSETISQMMGTPGLGGQGSSQVASKQIKQSTLYTPTPDPSLEEPTVSNLDRKVSSVISLRLYLHLLAFFPAISGKSESTTNAVASDKAAMVKSDLPLSSTAYDPVRLRAWLTYSDPGPGAWNTAHCLHLILRAQQEGLFRHGWFVQAPQDGQVDTTKEQEMGNAIVWLKSFFETYSVDNNAPNPTRPDLTLRSTAHDTIPPPLTVATAGQPSTSDWNQAAQALWLVFGANEWMESSAKRELRLVLEWMTAQRQAPEVGTG